MDFKMVTTPFGKTSTTIRKNEKLRKDEQNTGADSEIFEFPQ